MQSLDDFVNNLQEQIFNEAKEAYGEKGFGRWRNPRYQGRMANADAHARVTGQCGDSAAVQEALNNYMKPHPGR